MICTCVTETPNTAGQINCAVHGISQPRPSKPVAPPKPESELDRQLNEQKRQAHERHLNTYRQPNVNWPHAR